MAATLNKVLLMGNLTKDPELRYVPSGSAVANFTIAVNRAYKTQAGEKKEEVCFVRIVAWSRLAEICGEYLGKGRGVFVEGRLQSRTWETEDGSKRTTFEVVADNVQFLDKSSKTGMEKPIDASVQVNEEESLNKVNEEPSAEVQINEDDVPF
jgi:single-strand DNA-binding protein